jgi:hypothetical protein
MVARESWTDWESAVSLLAIDWCTVQGKFEPNSAEIAKNTEKCVRFLQPVMTVKPPRLLLSRPFDEISVRDRWRRLQESRATLGEAINAIENKVLPYRGQLEGGGFLVCHLYQHKLPGTKSSSRNPNDAGIIVGGTYRLKEWSTKREPPRTIVEGARSERETLYIGSYRGFILESARPSD